MRDAMERGDPLSRGFLESARVQALRQRAEKKHTDDELNAAISDSYAKGWNDALTEAAKAFDGCVSRRDFWDALDALGWIRA